MVEERITDIVPDISANDSVFLLSALPDPNLVFTNPVLSHKLNVEATMNAINEVFSRNAKLFFMSTEFVFDGKEGNYTEADIPNPTTLYGKQKLEVERYLGRSQGSWCIIRTGSTVSYNHGDDCRILKTYKAIISKNAEMAFDNIFTLTDVRDTSRVLIKMATIDVTGIYHVVSAPPVSRTVLGGWIKEYSGYGNFMSFKEVSFSKIKYPETRPLRSWLSNKKVIDHFQYTFLNPMEIVRQKVAIIDGWHDSGVMK